jgi:hypothetical protein
VRFDNVEFRGVRNLDHLSDTDVRTMWKKGTAPIDKFGESLEGHHHLQKYHREEGSFVVEIPENKHTKANKNQHPHGNQKGSGLTEEQRKDWVKTRKAFQKERARQELIKRGLL